MRSTISVRIRSYNRGSLLLQTVESVAGQTDPADEIIVSIDGSTDGSAAAV